MTLLLPDSRPGVGHDQRGRRILHWWCGGAELDAGQVLGADEAVLMGADQSDRRAVVRVERNTTQALGEQDVLGQDVLDRDHRPVAVETAEDDMSDRRVG